MFNRIKYTIYLMFALTLGVQPIFSQSIVFFPKVNRGNVVYLHLWDLVRPLSPALKISYALVPNDDFYLNYEAGLITDLNGRYITKEYFSNYGQKSIIGLSLGVYPMVRVNYADFAGFRINYSFKHRSFDKWVSRSGGNYSEKLNFNHSIHSLGIYWRYESKIEVFHNFHGVFAINMGLSGYYALSNAPDDVRFSSGQFEIFNAVKSPGFHLYPHVYFEMNTGFRLPSKNGLKNEPPVF